MWGFVLLAMCVLLARLCLAKVSSWQQKCSISQQEDHNRSSSASRPRKERRIQSEEDAKGLQDPTNAVDRPIGFNAIRMSPSGLRILAIDGGGVKGVLPAMALEVIESNMGKPIRECFDLICGTSTGGLIALMLTHTDMSASEIRLFSENVCPQIFSDPSYLRMFFKGSLYTRRGLERIHPYGSVGMEAVEEPRVCVTSCCQHRLFLFRNYAEGAHAWQGTSKCQVTDAALATSAAPILLPPLHLTLPDFDGERVFIDGGLLCNNPAEVALQEALALWPGQKISCLLSLGCGKTESVGAASGGALSFGLSELPRYACDTELVHNKMENIAQQSECLQYYFRLNPLLEEEVGIDSVDDETARKIKQAGKKYFESEPIQPSGQVESMASKLSGVPLASPGCALYRALK